MTHTTDVEARYRGALDGANDHPPRRRNPISQRNGGCMKGVSFSGRMPAPVLGAGAGYQEVEKMSVRHPVTGDREPRPTSSDTRGKL